MEIISTKIPDLLIIKPKVFSDDRGYFFESFKADFLKDAGIISSFVQDNESQSSFGVLRGLHYQLEPYAQTKLVRVIKGKVYDVAVDIRKNSPTFGKWEGVELSEENKLQMLIPKGFAHGFLVLSETAIFSYKCDNYYTKESERGILYKDPALAINWPVNEVNLVLSEKDKLNPLLKDADMNFIYNH